MPDEQQPAGEALQPVAQEHRGRERSLANLKPPWQAGQSGNPGGKPKGASILAPLLRKLAADPNELGEGRLAEQMADDLIAGVRLLAEGVHKDLKVDVAPILSVMEKTDPKAMGGSFGFSGNGHIEWGEEPDEPEAEEGA